MGVEMKQIPIKEDNISTYNKKAIKIIVIFIVLGIITGSLLSLFFMNETNSTLQEILDQVDDRNPEEVDRYFAGRSLTISDIIVPSIGVIIVCISAYFLFGLILIYCKIFFTTDSKYIVGLLFFLFPLFIHSLFNIRVLGSLFISSSILYTEMRQIVDFTISGLGGIIVLLSIFEIIGLGILLYLSTE
jgi:hypothetical protein